MSSALSPVKFIGGASVSVPVSIAKAATATFPLVGAYNFAGFNTLSVFITTSAVPAANTLTIKLVTIDPDTGVALASSLGNLTLFTITTNASFATSVYLPTYYATLTGLVLPFYYEIITLAHTGATNTPLSVDAFKLWLTNA